MRTKTAGTKVSATTQESRERLARVAVNSPEMLSGDQYQAHVEQEPKKLPRRETHQAEGQQQTASAHGGFHIIKRLNAAPSGGPLQDKQLVWRVRVAVLYKKASR